ncbi:MAG: endonuclease/exonuclease/phosphatase family protein [Phycisphaerae bacterium]
MQLGWDDDVAVMRPPVRTRVRRKATLWQTLLSGSGPAVCGAWLVGWLLRDRWLVTRLCYYVPPLFVVAFALAWWLLARRRRPWARLLVLSVAVGAALKAGLGDTCWHARVPTPAGALRLVHWNTAWGDFDSNCVWRTVAADQPDVVVFSEPPRDLEWRWRELFPQGDSHIGAGMALLSRWPIDLKGSLVVPGVRSWHIRVATPAGPLDVLGVDLESDPFIDHGGPLRQVARWVMDHGRSPPLIVVGDFNTPRDSRFFDPLRTLAGNAYEQAGAGWPYSWPCPVPLWAIDQAWCTPGLRVVNHRLKFAPCSDHMRQVMELEMAPP